MSIEALFKNIEADMVKKFNCKTPDDCRIKDTALMSSTMAFYPPVWNGHGKNVNPDKNTVVKSQTCETCGKVF